jgi:hypothetical protein
MNQRDFKVVHVYQDSLEAELAKNCLVASGINAMITNDHTSSEASEKGVAVVVLQRDYNEALQILQGHDEEMTEEDRSKVEEDLKENAQAKKEFADLRKQELEGKVLRKEQSRKIWMLSLLVSIAVFFAIPNRTLAPRIALAILFYAVIEFFTWRDCLKAEDELKKNNV